MRITVYIETWKKMYISHTLVQFSIWFSVQPTSDSFIQNLSNSVTFRDRKCTLSVRFPLITHTHTCPDGVKGQCAGDSLHPSHSHLQTHLSPWRPAQEAGWLTAVRRDWSTWVRISLVLTDVVCSQIRSWMEETSEQQFTSDGWRHTCRKLSEETTAISLHFLFIAPALRNQSGGTCFRHWSHTALLIKTQRCPSHVCLNTGYFKRFQIRRNRL